MLVLAQPLGHSSLGAIFGPALLPGRDFVCGERSCSSAEFRGLFMSLQTSLNVFAVHLGLPPLTVDGLIGRGTEAMVKLTGQFLKGSAGVTGQAGSGIVDRMAAGMTKAEIASQARVLDSTLTVAVTLLGLVKRFTEPGAPSSTGPSAVGPPPAQVGPQEQVPAQVPGTGPLVTTGTPPKSNTALIVGGVVVGLGALGGLIYAFTR